MSLAASENDRLARVEQLRTALQATLHARVAALALPEDDLIAGLIQEKVGHAADFLVENAEVMTRVVHESVAEHRSASFEVGVGRFLNHVAEIIAGCVAVRSPGACWDALGERVH